MKSRFPLLHTMHGVAHSARADNSYLGHVHVKAPATLGSGARLFVPVFLKLSPITWAPAEEQRFSLLQGSVTT